MSSISEPLKLWRWDCVLSVCKFRTSDRALERQLDHTKWFDYRFMTPWKATELFQQSYQKIYQQKFQRGASDRGIQALLSLSRADFEFLSLAVRHWGRSASQKQANCRDSQGRPEQSQCSSVP